MKVSLYKMEERIKINQDTVVFGKFYVHIKSVENKQQGGVQRVYCLKRTRSDIHRR